jgi:hypothetical protein
VKFRVTVDGYVREVEAPDAEDAARTVVEGFLWPDDPPGDGDTVTAHVVAVGGTEVTSWDVSACYSLDGITDESDDEPTDNDLVRLGVTP